MAATYKLSLCPAEGTAPTETTLEEKKMPQGVGYYHCVWFGGDNGVRLEHEVVHYDGKKVTDCWHHEYDDPGEYMSAIVERATPVKWFGPLPAPTIKIS